MSQFSKLSDIVQLSLFKTKDVDFTLGTLIILILVFFVTKIVLRLTRRLLTRKLPLEDKNKFVSIFQFIQYIVYLFVIMFTLNASGVNVSVLLTASAAIFLGLGFALQQLFQDVISGILIILDQSLHVGDIIEVDGKVCKVQKVSLRSTKAVTRNERVLVIPNHKFLSDVLFNWTQNSPVVRENIDIKVGFDSDVSLVKKILLDVASQHPEVMKDPAPLVFFEHFGDYAYEFTLYTFIDNVFFAPKIKSEIRFNIEEKFRSHAIRMPFPKRDVHINTKMES